MCQDSEQPMVGEESRIDALLGAGGVERVNLLRYAVRSVTMEVMMHFLVREYRFHPTLRGALALYDVFCAPRSPARLPAAEAVPARWLPLGARIEGLRGREQAFDQAAEAIRGGGEDTPLPPPPLPDRALYDEMVRSMWTDPGGALQRVEREYDSSRMPDENLPGGRLSPAQRNFVDRVWRPEVRPHLVDAGFWQLSSID